MPRIRPETASRRAVEGIPQIIDSDAVAHVWFVWFAVRVAYTGGGAGKRTVQYAIQVMYGTGHRRCQAPSPPRNNLGDFSRIRRSAVGATWARFVLVGLETS